MKKYIRLLDHSIDGATNLTVDAGRFSGSVSLTIGGTPGRMTVNASDLLAALQEIMRGWPQKTSGESDGTAEKPRRERKTRASITQKSNSIARPRGNMSRARTLIFSKKSGSAGTSTPNLESRENMPWTEYEDHVLDVLSPEFASEKLHRPLSEIHARLRKLGLERLSN
jgi:hypothetical protein